MGEGSGLEDGGERQQPHTGAASVTVTRLSPDLLFWPPLFSDSRNNCAGDRERHKVTQVHLGCRRGIVGDEFSTELGGGWVGAAFASTW